MQYNNVIYDLTRIYRDVKRGISDRLQSAESKYFKSQPVPPRWTILAMISDLVLLYFPVLRNAAAILVKGRLLSCISHINVRSYRPAFNIRIRLVFIIS